MKKEKTSELNNVKSFGEKDIFSATLPRIQCYAPNSRTIYLYHLTCLRNSKVLNVCSKKYSKRCIVQESNISIFVYTGGDKTKCIKTSFLLGLLKDVNNGLQSHAMAAGLLERQRLDESKSYLCSFLYESRNFGVM